MKTTRVRKGKGNNGQRLAFGLSTGFPQLLIHWQTRFLPTQAGARRPLPTEAALCSETVGHTAVSQAGGWWGWALSIQSPLQGRKYLTPQGPLWGCPSLLLLQWNTGQSGRVLRADLPMGSFAPPTPAWMTLNSASTFPIPFPWLHPSLQLAHWLAAWGQVASSVSSFPCRSTPSPHPDASWALSSLVSPPFTF